MDFEIHEELKLLKNTVRTFVYRELIPIEMKAMDGPSLRQEIRAELERKAKELGLWLEGVPVCAKLDQEDPPCVSGPPGVVRAP